MSLESIYKRIKDEIQNLRPNIPALIYTGVGTFAGLKNDNGVLEPQNYHQFPPFLQELYRVIPNLQLYIVLIDSMQENPPYLTRDFPLINSALDMYRNNQLTVYVWRQRVYTQPHEPLEDAVNITKALRDLNTFAVQNSVSTFYHNFTGARNHILAEFFDPELLSDVDHIIYGFSMRRDHGCYFDLADIESYMPYRVVDETHATRRHLQFFNYYKYLLNLNMDMAEREKTLFPKYMHGAIAAQKDQIMEEQKQYLRVNILSTLRIAFKLKTAQENQAQENQAQEDPAPPVHYLSIDYLPCQIKKTIQTYTAKSDFISLYDFLLCYFGEQLNTLAHVMQLGDIDGHELLELITVNANPYQWALPF